MAVSESARSPRGVARAAVEGTRQAAPLDNSGRTLARVEPSDELAAVLTRRCVNAVSRALAACERLRRPSGWQANDHAVPVAGRPGSRQEIDQQFLGQRSVPLRPCMSAPCLSAIRGESAGSPAPGVVVDVEVACCRAGTPAADLVGTALPSRQNGQPVNGPQLRRSPSSASRCVTGNLSSWCPGWTAGYGELGQTT
jgi:hypothetical protein